MKKFQTPSTKAPMVQEIKDIELDDLPTEAQMEALGIAGDDFGPFMRAFTFTLYQSQGLSIAESARRANIPRSNLYEEHWNDLVLKAQRLIFGKLSTGIIASRNRVVEEWPNLINRLVKKMQDPDSELKDVVAAMEFLHEAIISQQAEPKRDDSQERKYLAEGNNFNPMLPAQIINAEAGSTIIVNGNAEAHGAGDKTIYLSTTADHVE